MATRTVRDRDRCGKPDIREDPVEHEGDCNVADSIDLCRDCMSVLFPEAAIRLSFAEFQKIKAFASGYRASIKNCYGATPNDMRP